MQVQDKLRLLQEIAGVSQTELARQLGVSFVTLNRWVNEKAEPRAAAERRITSLFRATTGTSEDHDDPLSAKKAVLLSRASQQSSVLQAILKEPDIRDEFVLRLTFTSNQIEGSTLTEAETAAILFHNDNVPRRSLIEQLEAKNHQAALEFLFRHGGSGGVIDEALILRLHAILMNGVRDDAGSYRSHAVRIVGANVPTANYLRVPDLMGALLKDAQKGNADPIQYAAAFHSAFEQIHPFSDGNGRVGRLLLHAMLVAVNYPPAVIRPGRRRVYHRALNVAQREGNIARLEDVICTGVLEGWRILQRT